MPPTIKPGTIIHETLILQLAPLSSPEGCPKPKDECGFVDLNCSPRRRAMSAICAQQTAGTDVLRT